MGLPSNLPSTRSVTVASASSNTKNNDTVSRVRHSGVNAMDMRERQDEPPDANSESDMNRRSSIAGNRSSAPEGPSGDMDSSRENPHRPPHRHRHRRRHAKDRDDSGRRMNSGEQHLERIRIRHSIRV